MPWIFEEIEHGIEIKYQAEVSCQFSVPCEDQKASTERFRKTFNSYNQKAVYAESQAKYLNLMERQNVQYWEAS